MAMLYTVYTFASSGTTFVLDRVANKWHIILPGVGTIPINWDVVRITFAKSDAPPLTSDWGSLSSCVPIVPARKAA